MPFADSHGAKIYYTDTGTREPAYLCLPGWCVHQTIFAPVAERLSARHRVLALDWRGHGESETPERDFGHQEMVADVRAVIEASGAQTVIPIAQAHGGWVAVELRRRLGERVPGLIFTSWNPIFTRENPLAAPFLDALRTLQDRTRWREVVQQLLAIWLRDAPASVNTHIRGEMEGHGFEDWARAAREIRALYAREGDPLSALRELRPTVPALHLYAQPRTPEYLSAQESFASGHSWFAVRRLEAASHFPMLEAPDETAGAINDFVSQD